jgi:translation initiation factor IF-3
LKKFYKTNQYIKAEEVRVIDSKGNQLGVMSLTEALNKAREEGKDLIEVAANAKPPVAKIIEFSKFKYQEAKKERQGTRDKQKTKEIRLSPFMAEHDLDVRIKKAKTFLSSGDRVKLVVKFKGRQIQSKEFGEKLINNALQKLELISSIAEAPKLIGKSLIAQIKPTGKKNETKTEDKKDSSQKV